MTYSAISKVFEFISKNRGYRASMGVIISRTEKKTVLCWGAVNGDDYVVPELAAYQVQWPDAIWMPLSEQQAQLFDNAWSNQHAEDKSSFRPLTH